MRAAGLLGLVAALAVAPGQALAVEGYGVQVTRSDADILEADPGQVVTIGVRVVEDSGVRAEVEEIVSLPDGWRLVTPAQAFVLDARGSQTRLFGFSVPRNAAPGLYTVRYGVTGRSDPGVRDEEAVRVLVHTVSGLGVEILEQPSHVVAGETSTTRVLVRNDGNEAARIAIAVEGGNDVDVRAEPSVVDLGPRESREVEIVATPDSGIERYERTAVRVTVESLGADATRAGTVVWVPVYPRHARRPDVMRHLPLTAEARGAVGDGGVGGQLALYGAGDLDAEGRYAVDFEARGPDGEAGGTFGRRDELRATLVTPWGTARVGDQVWSTSPLLGPSRYARGAGLEVAAPGVSLGGHYAVTRFRADPIREASASLALGEGPVVGSVHVLHRSHERSGPDAIDTLASARVAWSPLDAFEVSGEVGVDRTAGAGLSLGYRLDASGRTPGGFAFDVTKAFGGEDFRGYYQDVDLTSAAVVVPLAPKWTAQVSALHRIDGIDPGPDDLAAPRDTVARAKVRAQALPGVSIAVGPEVSYGVDAIVPDARVLAVGGRAQVGWSSPLHAAWVETAAAWHEVGVDRDERVGAEVSGNLMVHPLPRQSVGVYGSWSGGFEDGPLLGRGDAIGLFLDWEPKDDLVFDVRGERGLDERAYVQLDGRATWRSPGGVEIGARGRWRASKRQEGSMAAEAWVAVPIGLPIGRRQDRGEIRGRIADVDGVGLGGVLVKAGDQVAVTDRRGWFALGVVPGGHLLTVDPAEIGLDRVSLTALPLAVEVAGGGRTDLSLAVADAASVSGVLTGPDGGPATMGGLRVVLGDGASAQVRVTDAHGRFAFRGVAPGDWPVRVETAALPAWHEVVGPAKVSLSAGQSQSLAFEVRPVDRALRMAAPRSLTLSPPSVVAAEAPPAARSPARTARAPSVTWTLAPSYDPTQILPECHEAIGAVWVSESWWEGPHPTDFPVVASSDLAEALQDPPWLDDFSTCAP